MHVLLLHLSVGRSGRAVAGVGHVNDCHSHGQSDLLLYTFTFSDRDAKEWEKMWNVNCMRQGFFDCFPSAHVQRLKLKQAAPAKLGCSLYYVTCALFCLVSISAVALDYSPPSLGAFKLNEAPPGELGCF